MRLHLPPAYDPTSRIKTGLPDFTISIKRVPEPSLIRKYKEAFREKQSSTLGAWLRCYGSSRYDGRKRRGK